MTLAAIAKAQAAAFLIGALDDAATLGLGDTLEAQVLRVLPDGRASLLIGRTALDVALSPEAAAKSGMEPGAVLTLRVDSGGAHPRLALLSIAPGELTDTAASARPLVTASEAPPHPAAAARDVALRHLAEAPGRQDGLSALFASLSEASRSPSLPPLIRQVVGALIALRVPVENLSDPQALEDAVARSGVFHEASAALGGVPRADLKGALSALQRLLQIWTVVARPAGTGPAPPGGPSPGGPSPGGPAPAAPPPGSPETARPGEVPSLPAAQRAGDPLAGDPLAGRSGPPAALPPGAAGAVRAAAAPGAVGAVGAALARLAVAFPDGDGSAPQAATAGTSPAPAEGRPPPPRRDAHPHAQPAVPVRSDLAAAEPARLVATLLETTEAALDRLKLSQLASLPTAAEAPRADTPAPQHWHVEIPLALGRETAVLALAVEREAPGRSGRAEEGERIWRLRFALDLPPLGPVHALVTLQGHDVGVSLWAEREGTSRLLRRHADDLRAALADQAFTPGSVDIATGAPPQRPRPAGHFLDRRT